MKTEKIKLYTHEKFGNVRIIEDGGEAWYCYKDVLKALGTKKFPKNELDEKLFKKVSLPTKGGEQRFVFVNENGLLGILSKTQNDNTKGFMEWLTPNAALLEKENVEQELAEKTTDNTGLKVYYSPEFGAFRTMPSSDGHILFCLVDVCKTLGLRAADVKRRVKNTSTVKMAVPDQKGRQQETNFVTFEGLKNVVNSSRKQPHADNFFEWIKKSLGVEAERKEAKKTKNGKADTKVKKVKVAKVTVQVMPVEEYKKKIVTSVEELKEISGDVRIFQNSAFGDIHTVADENNEPWFCLNDVCNVLGISGKRVFHRLDKKVLRSYHLALRGGKQHTTFVNEDGLYDVILDSKKPEAKRFRKWITSEVLPQIRKTGGYIPINEDDDEVDIMAKALKIANNHIAQKEKELAAKQKELERKDKQIDVLTPLAEYTRLALNSTSDMTLTQVAHALGLRSVYVLSGFLHDKGYIYKQSGQWQPTASVSTKKYFSTRTFPYLDTKNVAHSFIYLTVTELGRRFVYDELKNANLEELNKRYLRGKK